MRVCSDSMEKCICIHMYVRTYVFLSTHNSTETDLHVLWTLARTLSYPASQTDLPGREWLRSSLRY